MSLAETRVPIMLLDTHYVYMKNWSAISVERVTYTAIERHVDSDKNAEVDYVYYQLQQNRIGEKMERGRCIQRYAK